MPLEMCCQANPYLLAGAGLGNRSVSTTDNTVSEFAMSVCAPHDPGDDAVCAQTAWELLGNRRQWLEL